MWMTLLNHQQIMDLNHKEGLKFIKLRKIVQKQINANSEIKIKIPLLDFPIKVLTSRCNVGKL